MSTASSTDIVCAHIAEHLAEALGARKYNMWFNRSARFLMDEDGARLRIEVPNRFVADWIARNFDRQINAAAVEAMGEPVPWSVQVSPQSFAGEAASPGAPESPESPGSPVAPKTAPPPRRNVAPSLRHCLDDFIVGPSNELAFAAANRLVHNDRDPINPLFIHGGCGLGKTHLLQGVCRAMLDQQPQARVQYMTGEQFTNEFITAVRTNALVAFRRRIRRLDLLAVDDARFFANKQATQQEFLHTFDAIELGGAKLVLASDSHPRLIKEFSEALVNRCIRGMVVEVRSPDHETRLRIIEVLGRRRRLELNDSVTQLIAGHCRDSVREIEGVLTKIHALASLTNHPGSNPRESGLIEVGHGLVDHLFRSELVQTPRKALRFADMLETVCRELGVAREQVLGTGRHRHIVLARSLTIYLTRQLTSMSFPEIASAMDRTSHSTIITAYQRVVKQIEQDKAVMLPQGDGPTTMGALSRRLRYAVARG